MKSWTHGHVLPAAAVLLLWGGAFSMACRLSVLRAGEPASDESLAGRLLGAARVGLGEDAFVRADDYFHMGVGHHERKAFEDSVYQRLAADIRPSGHVHAEGYDVREIMPWLRVTTRMDPRNVPAYLTTAFWLAGALQRPDQAEQVLMEAQRNNPGDYRVLSERALLLLRRADDEAAARLFDAGIRRWPGPMDPEDEQARADLSQMLSYRGFLYSIGGDRDSAMRCFERALEAMPRNPALAARVEAFRRGEDTTERDRATWESLFKRRECAREHGDHDHDHDHDHE